MAQGVKTKQIKTEVKNTLTKLIYFKGELNKYLKF